MKKPIGIRNRSLVRKGMKEDSEHAALLYHQEGAMLELQDAVAAVLRNVGSCHLSCKKSWYQEAFRISGLSPRSLKRFLKRGGGIRQAVKILHAFGYRIAKISVEKLPGK